MKFLQSLESEKTKKRVKQIALFCVLVLMMTFMMALGVFAADGSEYVAIQASDLEPILEGAKANAAVVTPVGVGLFTISFGIGFAIGILKKFKKG